MSLNAALNLFLDEYPNAIKSDFAKNAVAEFIRKDVPIVIQEILGRDDRLIVHGSAGQGTWARVPWVAVFDRFITDTAQDGYYVVYLVKEDFTGIYISLNQGVTTVRAQYRGDAKKALAAKAADYGARLGKLDDSVIMGPIKLAIDSPTNLGAFYEQGSVCAKHYKKGEIPSDKVLNRDLIEMLELYQALSDKELVVMAATAEVDENDVGEENLIGFRQHKRIERNQKLAAIAKQIHGHVCQACGFNFEEKYGDIGKGFIEAHHLTPISELIGKRVKLNPKTDFAVLCSNCHRMIHKSEFVGDVAAFRIEHIKLTDV